MAKIVYGMLMSLDGYIAGPDGGSALPVPGSALHWHFNAMMQQTSVALYGRRMYEIVRYWETADKVAGASDVEVDFARAWQETPKIRRIPALSNRSSRAAARRSSRRHTDGT